MERVSLVVVDSKLNLDARERRESDMKALALYLGRCEKCRSSLGRNVESRPISESKAETHPGETVASAKARGKMSFAVVG